MMVTDFLILTMMYIQFILALILIYKAVKTKIQVIWLLVFISFIQAISFLHFLRTPILNLGFLLSYTVGISYLLAVFFIQKTFYKGQKRIYVIQVIIIFICTILTISEINDPYPFFHYSFTLYLFIWSNFALAAIPNYWCAYVILKQYFFYRNIDIQPWIKMRYLIAGMSHFWWASIGIGFILETYIIKQLPFATIWAAIVITIFTIGYFIAWVMPEPLKKFFNRHYKNIDAKQMTEEEIKILIKKVDNE